MLATLLKGSTRRRLELVDSASVTGISPTLTLPSSIQPGDLVVVMMAMGAFDGSEPTGGNLPSGWTDVAKIRAGASAVRSFYRIATSETAGSIVTGFSTVPEAQAFIVCLVFRFGASAISLANFYSHSGQITNSNPPTMTVTSGSGAAPLIVLAIARNPSGSGFSTFNPSPDGGVISGSAYIYAYKIFNSAPVDVVIDTPDGGTANILQSFYIQVS